MAAAHVSAEYDESATAFAKTAMVSQLRSALARFGFEKRPRPKPTGLRWGNDDDGTWWIRGRLSAEHGTVVDHALRTRRDDLARDRKATLSEGAPAEPVTNEQALWSIAESSLRDAQGARPSSDRYRIHLHLHQGADGNLALSTTLGSPLPAAFRRQVLCDATISALVATGLSDLAAGRTHHHIPRPLRRAILQRDQGCRIPGCQATTHLEIHHLHHWEHGGTTDPHNLITLCWHHHHLHHQGHLHLTGTATHLTITDRWGHPLEPTRPPTPPPNPLPNTRPYQSPTGERTSHQHFHLQPRPTTDTANPPNAPNTTRPPGDPPPNP